jgi:hypothetical protein
MFMGGERTEGMGSFLCAELLDFAAAERRHGGQVSLPSCGPGECPGLPHLPDLAREAEPEPADAADALLRRFGTALFTKLLRRYPSFFVDIASTTELLSAFEHQLAAEIGKLAPRVVLPSITLEAGTAPGVRFTCRFPDARIDAAPLVEGLVLGSARHFGEPFAVAWRPGPGPGVASFAIAPPARAAAGRGG